MGSFYDWHWRGRLTSHFVYSLKWFWPALSHLHGLKTSLFPERLWGKSRSETLHTKDALVLLLVRLAPKAGGQQEMPACCLPKEVPRLGAFLKPCPYPYPVMRLVTCSKAWANFKVPEVCSMFSNEVIYSWPLNNMEVRGTDPNTQKFI